jgi:DNA-binding MarR family transcriptional regulator
MTKDESLLHNCLYFTANSLSRVVTRMAEEEFRITGLSPSHAFLMMLVNDHPGIGQKELCDHLHLAPSTVTRFIDGLAHRGYLIRESEGKTTKIYTTPTGQNLQAPIEEAWKRLYFRYSQILGMEEGNALTRMIDEAFQKLSG